MADDKTACSQYLLFSITCGIRSNYLIIFCTKLLLFWNISTQWRPRRAIRSCGKHGRVVSAPCDNKLCLSSVNITLRLTELYCTSVHIGSDNVWKSSYTISRTNFFLQDVVVKMLQTIFSNRILRMAEEELEECIGFSWASMATFIDLNFN